jgi:hypothetical protein
MISGAPALLCKQLTRLALTPAAFKAAGAALKVTLDDHDEVTKAARKGRTRTTSRGSKSKGREGVLAVRDWLLAAFKDVIYPDDIVIQTTSVGGSDLYVSPMASRVFPYAPEIKNVQTLNVWKALKQAEVNARKRHKPPILFIKRNNTPLHVVIDAEAFADLLRNQHE